ncbi:hypothetical protein FIV36_04540 [Pseudomonas extremaustralis]|uniref:Uncharacterized protein n=1 Tax=Pseudomonas extremaustralis TaxID=359110 RepID=A0A5C5QM21_9PSED|nr:hypothetical protein FIV36_04540 [Pseudomonas extremaustralis]
MLSIDGFCAGASLLAKNLRAPLQSRLSALSLTFSASKLAPTTGWPNVVAAIPGPRAGSP